MVNGTLISFEGPEGAGKSSVLEAVLPLLEEKGIPFITTREPGGVLSLDHKSRRQQRIV